MDRAQVQRSVVGGRSSSSRFHCAGCARPLVVLALLALIVAPGTIFAVAAEPDSDLAPVRSLRRLAQTTNVGGVEYLQRAKLTATDGAQYDYFGLVSIDGDTMVIGAYGNDSPKDDSGSAYVFTRDTAGNLAR